MHRDIYPPLKPIFGHHFLALAHHEMRLEDLEVSKQEKDLTGKVSLSPHILQLAQRRLLRHFSYNLGIPTPQEFLDELPIALPTLRLTLGSERAWQDVLEETWKQLISAAHCTC
jgi:hypothetical protein